MEKVTVIDLGVIPYADALAIQEEKFNSLVDHKIKGLPTSGSQALYLCEHLPVITLGKSAKKENLLLSESFLAEKNIQVVPISRGGDVTYHGPGQLVGYPVLDLEHFTTDLKQYMRKLEEVIIRAISDFGLNGYRIDGETGVWVDGAADKRPAKICAFGVKTSRWVTMHGFALNVSPDLAHFNYIVPCGITDKGVTSVAKELNLEQIDMVKVKRLIIDSFAEVFEAEIS